MFSSSIVSMSLSLAITFLLAKLLSPIAFGVIVTAEAFLELFKFFFNFGLNNSIMKFASEHKEGFQSGLNKGIGNAFLIKALMFLPLTLLIIVVAKFTVKDPLILKIIYLYIGVYLLESFSFVFGIARRALGQFKLISAISILNKLIRLSIIALVLNFTKDLSILVLAFVLEKIIRLFISWITTIKFINIEIEKTSIKSMIYDCFGYAFVDPLQGVQTKIDRVMINSFLGSAAVAFYTIPSKITSAIQGFIKTGSNTLIPNLHNTYRNKNEDYVNSIKNIFRLSNIAAVLSFYVIYFFSEKILYMFFGDKYVDGYAIAFCFAYLAVINICENTSEIIFTTKASHKTRVFYKTLSLIINIVMNLLLIPSMGIKGAVFATIIANAVRMLIKFWFSRKELQLLDFIYFVLLPVLVFQLFQNEILIVIYLLYVFWAKQITLNDFNRLFNVWAKRDKV
jgi:O-antigen/teichoic acid export membrane protein